MKKQSEKTPIGFFANMLMFSLEIFTFGAVKLEDKQDDESK